MEHLAGLEHHSLTPCISFTKKTLKKLLGALHKFREFDHDKNILTRTLRFHHIFRHGLTKGATKEVVADPVDSLRFKVPPPLVIVLKFQ